MILHELCTTLNLVGARAGIIFITEGSQDSQNFKFGYSSQHTLYDPNGAHYDYFTNRTQEEIAEYLEGAFLIYPDIVVGNPLNAKKYATYVLGYPKTPILSETIISYSARYINDPDYILYKPFISEHMNPDGALHWSQRNLCLTYIGKGRDYADCSVIPNTVLIERDWPRDKRQLALLLRQCKYFYTWDCLSATNVDAVLCGAVPVFMQYNQLSKAEIDLLECGPMPHVDYASTIESKSISPNIIEIDEKTEILVSKLRTYARSWLNEVNRFVQSIQSKAGMPITQSFTGKD